MSVALPFGRPARRSRYRLRRFLTEATSVILGVVLLVWSLTPVYNMLLIALDAEGDNEFAGYIWPPAPTLDPQALPGRVMCGRMTPWAANELEVPPPGPRSRYAIPTASTAPSNGPAR